jgi:uncharacterized protein
MGERTQYETGTHSWVELSTSDAEGAKRFYSELLGWERTEDLAAAGGGDDERGDREADDEDGGERGDAGDDRGERGDAGDDRTYTMAYVGDKPVAGLFEAPDDGMPPHWNCYVAVDDLYEATGKVEEAGGEVALPPFDVMNAGSMAVIKDPSGAFLSLWQAKEHPGAGRVNEPGCLAWNDLNTSDPEAARKFYEQLFGWQFDKVDDAGEVDYWTITNGGRQNGGIRAFGEAEREADLMSHWLPYFAVEDVEAALKKVQELDGNVMAGPIDVSGGRFGIVQDPQGAPFGVFSGEFDD